MIKKNFHPLLFAIYPILFVYVNNIQYVRGNDLVIPIFLSISLAFLLFFVFKLLYKTNEKATLAISLFLIIFFSYTPLYEKLVLISPIGANRSLSLVYFLFWITLSIALWRTKRKLNTISEILNRVGCLLILINLGTFFFNIIWTLASNSKQKKSPHHEAYGKELDNSLINANKKTEKKKPSIYYIILDGYANNQVLRDYYQFDNTKFSQGLKDLGFFVFDNSKSSYTRTLYSLGSSMNLNYINGTLTGKPIRDYPLLESKIQNPYIKKYLKKQGYKLCHIYSGHYPTNNLSGFDYYFSKNGTFLSFFMQAVLQNTPLYRLFLSEIKKVQIDYIFNCIPKGPTLPEPIFYFVHILSPHPSAVYKADGSSQNKRVSEKEGYLSDVQYLNFRILRIVKEILEKSKTPPIIILQGDHGWSLREWGEWITIDEKALIDCNPLFGAFNAIYAPGAHLEPNQIVAPINTFRFILNQYFGENLKYLEERQYLIGPKKQDIIRSSVINNIIKEVTHLLK